MVKLGPEMSLVSSSGPQAYVRDCRFGCDPPFIKMNGGGRGRGIEKGRDQHVMPFSCHLVVSMGMHMGKTVFRRLLTMFTHKDLLVH